jgi:phosphoserine phosphatase
MAQQVITKHSFEQQNTTGFGDTGNDIALLRELAHPIAVMPSGELVQYAADQKLLALGYEEVH